MLTIGIEQAKAAFFDTEKVLRAMDRAERKALSKAGAFIRRRARSSIRKRSAASPPGRPPSSHTGLLRNFIFFSYDFGSRSVVIGPTRTNQVFFMGDGTPVRGTGAQVLEEGGSIRLLEVLKHGVWDRADLRSKRRLEGLPTRLRTIHIAARPYMGPALQAEMAAGTIADQFRGSLRA